MRGALAPLSQLDQLVRIGLREQRGCFLTELLNGSLAGDGDEKVGETAGRQILDLKVFPFSSIFALSAGGGKMTRAMQPSLPFPVQRPPPPSLASCFRFS
jgi:hypothetical protein